MTTIYFKRLLIFCFVLTSSFVFSQKSKVYKNQHTQMRVKFPCNYVPLVTEKENYTTYRMKCKNSEITYIASVTVHKLKMTNVKKMVKISLDAFSNNFKNATTIYTKDWKVAKKTGIKRQLLYKGNLLNYYVIISGNKQYQLIVFGNKDKSNDKTRNVFINSFKLL